MRSRLLNEKDPRIFAVVLDQGEEVHDALLRFAREHMLFGAEFTAIGALQDVVVAFFDREAREYRKIPLDEQVEVLALNGNIAMKDGQPKLHAHIVVGKRDGTAHGGHLMSAHVWPTLELVVRETPAHLQRRIDDETGLALLDPAA
jgi:uncharacterized protein